MGIFSPPLAPTPPPPPPLPPAANPQTAASSQVKAAGQQAQARARMAAGAGFNQTDLTGGSPIGGGPPAKAQLIGGTA